MHTFQMSYMGVKFSKCSDFVENGLKLFSSIRQVIWRKFTISQVLGYILTLRGQSSAFTQLYCYRPTLTFDWLKLLQDYFVSIANLSSLWLAVSNWTIWGHFQQNRSILRIWHPCRNLFEKCAWLYTFCPITLEWSSVWI